MAPNVPELYSEEWYAARGRARVAGSLPAESSLAKPGPDSDAAEAPALAVGALDDQSREWQGLRLLAQSPISERDPTSTRAPPAVGAVERQPPQSGAALELPRLRVLSAEREALVDERLALTHEQLELAQAAIAAELRARTAERQTPNLRLPCPTRSERFARSCVECWQLCSMRCFGPVHAVLSFLVRFHN